MPDVTRTITVAAPASVLYGLVSDLPRMGEWSPECTGVTWKSGTPGPAVGARFVGRNRAGWARWLTQGEVTDADPDRGFAFAIRFGPVPVSLWSYAFAAAGDGCEITESWTDRRPAVVRVVMNGLFGDRAKLNARSMKVTLERLKVAAEGRPVW